jgi:methylmalonyl-CoA mutase cobalamin-binding subunit
VTGTPAGQLHEIGALSASLLATAWGWRVVYLGASTPATELAATAEQSRARAIALSISYPPDDPFTVNELRALRACVGADYPILVGGRCSRSYLAALHDVGAIAIFSVDDLRRALDGLLQAAPPGS